MPSHDPKVFKEVWNALSKRTQEKIKAKAKWEKMTLAAVMTDYPDYLPKKLRFKWQCCVKYSYWEVHQDA